MLGAPKEKPRLAIARGGILGPGGLGRNRTTDTRIFRL